jgi:aldose 1-epimerase
VADYEAKVDAPSPVNLTNHAFFNLAGESRGMNILSSEMKLYSSSYIEVDDALIPTGKLLPTENTPFDFRNRKPIGKDLPQVQGSAGGYDHCFVIDGEPGKLRPFAEVYEPFTERSMKIFSTQPGIQFFGGNNISSMKGKIGSVYEKYGGFCLETQHFPDAPNKPGFPSAIFGPLPRKGGFFL